jgi:hypothetical protein
LGQSWGKVGEKLGHAIRVPASQVRPEGAPDSIISEENEKITERITPPEAPPHHSVTVMM